MSTPGPSADRSASAPRNRSLVRALRRRRQLRAGLVQLAYVAVGAVAGVLSVQVSWTPRIDGDHLTAVFAGIGGGLIALVSVVYGLLFLVIQFASTTHSPRLNLFRDSPLVWNAFGVFLGSFAYVSTVALTTAPGATVSILVPALGLLSVLVCMAFARRLQLSALNSLQLAPILQDLADRGRTVLDQLYPAPFTDAPPGSLAAPEHPIAVVWPWLPAVLRQIDLPPLLAVAERLDGEIVMTVGVGDMLWQNEVVIKVSGDLPSGRLSVQDENEMLAGFEAGIERSFAQDPLLAFRLLNDIGLRACSPANSDPYTAIQVLDTIEGLLRRLTTRHLDVSVVPGGDGRPRVRLALPDWDRFLEAAVDEFLDAGRGFPTVRRRLLTLLDNLIALSPAPRLPALQRRRALLADT